MTRVMLGGRARPSGALVASAGAMFAVDALAQVPNQLLAVQFSVPIVQVPLSPWLTVALFVALAASAYVFLRRSGTRGGRLLGVALAMAAGGVMLAAGGQRLVSEAIAGADPPLITLTTSPGTLDVGVYMSETLVVPVDNNSGKTATIVSISLANGPFAFDTPHEDSCFVGLQLLQGGSCNIYLTANSCLKSTHAQPKAACD